MVSKWMGHVPKRWCRSWPSTTASCSRRWRAAGLASTRVTADDLERELAAVRVAAPADPRAGAFGQDLVMWRIDREALLFFGAGARRCCSWPIPAVAAASAPVCYPTDRPFPRTFGINFVLVFGTLDRASAATRRLGQLHGAIQEILPSAPGPFAAGSQYHAKRCWALRWVHATLIGTSLAVRGRSSLRPEIPFYRRFRGS
jgi:ER-bound oxygenase mpaB/B'/Rubber oxygenase, catalytic domain